MLARDLHRLAESAAAERELVTRVPSLTAPLALLRFAELAGRRRKGGLSHTERRVEAMLAALLASPPDQIPSPIPACATPTESRAWADAMADEILRESGGRSPYRPRNPMSLWGLAWSHYAEPTDEPLGPGGGGGSSPDPSAQSRARDDNATRRVRTDDASDDDASQSQQGDATDDGGRSERDARAERVTAVDARKTVSTRRAHQPARRTRRPTSGAGREAASARSVRPPTASRIPSGTSTVTSCARTARR